MTWWGYDMTRRQFSLIRSKGVMAFDGDPAPRHDRSNVFMVYCGWKYPVARRKAHDKVKELYPDKLMRRFALSETSHAWLVQEPHTGEPVELFVLQPS